MTDYAIVLATWAHVRDLAATMRAADKAECAALGYGPYDALRTSVGSTAEPFAGLADGKVVCLFGVSNGLHPWLLASDDLLRHRREFLRASRAWVEGVRREYPVLYNWVGADNVLAIRWLRWLGFTVTDQVSRGLRTFHS